MADKELPTNWRAAKDSDGKEYYFNELTGETSWVFPEIAGGKPADSAELSPAITSDSPERSAPGGSRLASADEVNPAPIAVSSFGGAAARYGGAADGISALVGADNFPKLIVILVSSFVLLMQSAIELGRRGGGEYAYGVSVACIDIGMLGVYFFLCKKKPHVITGFVLPKVPGELNLSQLLAIFHAIWWFCAVGVLTFGSPFLKTTNAFFACWAAFVASMLVLASTFQKVATAFTSMSSLSTDVSVQPIAGLFMSSGVVFFCCIDYLSDPNSGNGVYGFIVSLVTCVLSLGLFVMVRKEKLGPGPKKGLSAALCLLWIITTCILTFEGPFLDTGNGYFSSWAATGFSASFAYQSFVQRPMHMMSRVRNSFAFNGQRGEHDTASARPRSEAV